MIRGLTRVVSIAGRDVHLSEQCVCCSHWTGVDLRCRAFPAGIPAEIRAARHDHSRPFEGDQGYLYSPNGWEKFNPPGRKPPGRSA